VPCINPRYYPYDPTDPNQSNLELTHRLRDDTFVQAVVEAFMNNYVELCDSLAILLTATGNDKLRQALYDLPIPAPRGQLELLKAVENLYNNHKGNQENLNTARGVIFEMITFRLVQQRYSREGDVCEHNVKVALLGTQLKQLVTEVTPKTVDIAAWHASAHESEFYECKIQIVYVEPDDVESIDKACEMFLTSNLPHSSLAAVCTLSTRRDIARLVGGGAAGGLRQAFAGPYPRVRFLYLDEVIAMS
jgi:hypothetical protein